MTRAEEKALKAYPVQMVSGPIGHEEPKFDINGLGRTIFIEGYEQAEKDLGWHSVEESLPPVDEEVIVLTNRVRDIELESANRICVAHIVDKELAMDWDGWNIPGVRYWMHCPELPEDAK